MTRTLLVALALLAAPLPARSAPFVEVEGVRYRTLREASPSAPELHLHGAGLLRYKGIFKAYVAALYLGGNAGADRALDAATPRRLEIEYFFAIPAHGFADVTREGIARTTPADEYASIAASVDRFCALYRDVKPGDRYSIEYVPGAGTRLALNDEVLGTVEGDAFARALFGLWLGDGALDRSLRQKLLERIST